MKVFVIDDDPVYKLIVQRMFNEMSETVSARFFNDGRKAMDVLEGWEPVAFPDIIMLDIEMPEMDGWAFMDAFRTLPAAATAHTKIYIITSSIANEDVQKAGQYPEIIKYIPKPITQEILKGIIGRH
ncbi:MAG: response regulator [Niabella sp.]|nr:response regulator [Niabella sp.]